jgi:hypothetical protein
MASAADQLMRFPGSSKSTIFPPKREAKLAKILPPFHIILRFLLGNYRFQLASGG